MACTWSLKRRTSTFPPSRPSTSHSTFSMFGMSARDERSLRRYSGILGDGWDVVFVFAVAWGEVENGRMVEDV